MFKKKNHFIDLILILVNYNNPVLNIKFGMITWIILVNSDIWIIINARQGHKYVILQMFCGPILLLLSSLNHKIWIKTADYSKLKGGKKINKGYILFKMHVSNLYLWPKALKLWVNDNKQQLTAPPPPAADRPPPPPHHQQLTPPPHPPQQLSLRV